jgi:hypothetical protein
VVLPFVARIAKHAKVQKAWHYVDSAFGLVSMAIVPVLFGVYGFWHFEKPAFHNLNQVRQTIEVPAGASTTVGDSLTLKADVKSAVYSMWLSDAQGSTVYVYPDIKIDNPDHISFESQTVQIPASLKPGTYTLTVDLEYPLNPIKTASVRMELARLKVTQQQNGVNQ